jgi:DNA-binding NarL/FixJ family response regulator
MRRDVIPSSPGDTPAPANIDQLLKHLAEPLSCLATIEQCIADSTHLPPREREVCSRVIFGMSSLEIAGDLHLCEPTVKTYRKRAYERLSVAREHDLLTWYLRTWAGWLQRPKS